MDEVTIEVLWLEQTDDGYPIKDSVLLVGDRLIGGVKHPNGVAFQVPLSAYPGRTKGEGGQLDAPRMWWCKRRGTVADHKSCYPELLPVGCGWVRIVEENN